MTPRARSLADAEQPQRGPMSAPKPWSDGARATALGLIGQYVEDAEVMAVMRAAEVAALGGVAGLAQWDEIIACILAIENGDAGARRLQ